MSLLECLKAEVEVVCLFHLDSLDSKFIDQLQRSLKLVRQFLTSVNTPGSDSIVHQLPLDMGIRNDDDGSVCPAHKTHLFTK